MDIQKNETGLYEVEIDGSKYEFQKWGAEESYDTLLDLARVCGKPLGLAIQSFFIGDKDKELPPNIMSDIFEALTQGLGEKELVKRLTKKFTSGDLIRCNGAKIVFNVHYADRLDHMFKVLRAGLEVQYGNFIAAVLGQVGLSMPKSLTNHQPTT